MNLRDLLMALSVSVLYLGIAGVWGALLRPGRSALLAAVYAVFFLLPFSLALPFDRAGLLAAWLAGFGAVLTTSLRPLYLPGWKEEARFTRAYFGAALLLVCAWCLLAGSGSLLPVLGLVSGLGGVGLLKRALLSADTAGRGMVKKVSRLSGD